MADAREFKMGDRVKFERAFTRGGEAEEWEGTIVSIDGRWDNVLQDNLKVVRNCRVALDDGAVVVVRVEELWHAKDVAPHSRQPRIEMPRGR